MHPPFLSVCFYDDATSPNTLYRSISHVLTRAGAEILDKSSRATRISGFVPPTEESRYSDLTVVDDVAPGALVELLVPIGDMGWGRPEEMKPDDWRPILKKTADLVAAVEPLVAGVGFDASAVDIADPGFDDIRSWISAGWLDTRRCPSPRRRRFEKLVQAGVAVHHGEGLWWSTFAPLSLRGEVPDGLDDWDLAAMIYSAWSGAERPEKPADIEIDEPVERPELWFWRPDLEPERFYRLFVDAASRIGLEADTAWAEQPGWCTGVARLESRNFLTPALLSGFEQMIQAVRPAWAAILPVGVDWPLGMFFPEFGKSLGPPIWDLWVDRSWAGDILTELDELFAGAHRADIDGGVLWVSTQSLAPEAAITEPAASATHRLEISAKLGEVVRRSVVARYGAQPGFTE